MTRTRALMVTAVTAATFAFSAPAQAAVPSSGNDHQARTVVYTLDDSSHGNPEGVAWDGRFFYVGATGDGTIYRGTLGDPTVHTFISGATGRVSVGMKASGHKLYVAGGATGTIFVYDLKNPTTAPVTIDTGAGGFLNDLVVTQTGDVYVTDSFRPTLWHVAADQVKPGGTVDPISVSPEIAYTAGAFNLNGIVASPGGRELLVVNTADGKLYRIRFHGGSARTIIRVHARALVGGDGMIMDDGKLVVVRGDPATLTLLKPTSTHFRAHLVQVFTNPTLRGPSTVAVTQQRYLVVNADFATSTPPFTISGVPRDRD
jgi:hypothetical protein